MIKTLRISFTLKNTYRVNSILYSIKQIPLLKKILPDRLYQVQAFKIVANVISVIWEVVSALLGKFLYFLLMIVLAGKLYETNQTGALFLHIFLMLTFIGSFTNTLMFNPAKSNYYAIILLNMNAREYTIINYFYGIAKIIIGFALFGISFGVGAGVPFWQCLLIPFFTAGSKMLLASIALRHYEKTGDAANENLLGKFQWLGILLLLAAAYGLPAADIIIPDMVSMIIMATITVSAVFSAGKILKFKHYRAVYREMLINAETMRIDSANAMQAQSHKTISSESGIESKRKGFEYLNELFIKRHRKILWKPAKRIAVVCLVIIVAALAVFHFFPETKDGVHTILMTSLPWFLFIMYALNRGTGFTRALFINCDHSLLTYSFYKQPKFILKLFQIRLREIIKINLLPAVVIGVGLVLLLFASGGTDAPLNYAVLPVSIICLSIFFSVHYLTIYYLLQPYNAATEVKSGMYKVITTVTYMVCYFMMQMELPTLYFGLATIIFCVLYCIVASILVYKLAPKTFRIRT